MAYMSKEKAAEIRRAIKAAFKNIKFSISVKDHAVLNVKIMESNLFEDGEEIQYLHRDSRVLNDAQKEVINKLHDIVCSVGEYYNNSDVQSDYFDYAFYYYIGVGKWDKHHVAI